MRNLFIIFLISFTFVLAISADDIVLSRDSRTTGVSIVSDRVMDRAFPTLTMECFVSKLTADVVNTPQGNFTLLSIPRYHTSSTLGTPSLPMMNRLVEIPFDAKLNVKVLSYEEQEYSLKDLGITYPLFPYQPSHPKDGSKVEFAYDRNSYGKDSYQQEELASITDVGIMRNVRLGLLKVSPVAYNPVQGKIKVFNNIRVEVSMSDANMTLTTQMQQQYYSPYFAWVDGKILSADSLKSQRADLTRYPVTYVIVADRMFEKDLEAFIEWKNEKGFKVVTAYTDTIGKTKEEIQKYLHNLYKSATPDNPAPTFVLFVGDTAQIPSFAGTTGSHVTDLYYVDVTGDNIPDMYTGRFSANNSGELIPQIEKTLEYEQYKMADTSFLKKTVLIAGWDSGHAVEWGWPQINYATKYYYNSANGYSDVYVYLSAGSGQNSANIVNNVSAGVGFVNYTAHGSSTSWADPGFTMTNINSLANKGKYPLIVGNCCLTNKFEVTTCFGEAWLRAKDKGAIGYIGGSNSTYWDEDLWWGNGYYAIVHPNSQGAAPKKEDTGTGAYDAVFTAGYATSDAMILAGNLAVQESSTSRKKYYWEVYHLMGDPSVMIYWGLPKKMTVSHAAEVAQNSASLVVKAEAGAYVGLSMNGELVAAALAKENGDAELKFASFPGTGTAVVVVTKQNREPYRGEIKVK